MLYRSSTYSVQNRIYEFPPINFLTIVAQSALNTCLYFSNSSEIFCYDIYSRSVIGVLNVMERNITSVCNSNSLKLINFKFTANGKYLITATLEGKIAYFVKIWELTNDSPLSIKLCKTCMYNNEQINEISMCPEDNLFVVSLSTSEFDIWMLDDKEWVQSKRANYKSLPIKKVTFTNNDIHVMHTTNLVTKWNRLGDLAGIYNIPLSTEAIDMFPTHNQMALLTSSNIALYDFNKIVCGACIESDIAYAFVKLNCIAIVSKTKIEKDTISILSMEDLRVIKCWNIEDGTQIVTCFIMDDKEGHSHIGIFLSNSEMHFLHTHHLPRERRKEEHKMKIDGLLINASVITKGHQITYLNQDIIKSFSISFSPAYLMSKPKELLDEYTDKCLMNEQVSNVDLTKMINDDTLMSLNNSDDHLMKNYEESFMLDLYGLT